MLEVYLKNFEMRERANERRVFAEGEEEEKRRKRTKKKNKKNKKENHLVS